MGRGVRGGQRTAAFPDGSRTSSAIAQLLDQCGDGQQVTFSFTNATVTPEGRPLTAELDTGSMLLPTGADGGIERELVTAAP
jgi:hypothetical protein